MKEINIIMEDSTLRGIAGYDFGEDMFNKQIKDKIELNEECTIIFPKTIEKVAISFVQGFSKNFIKLMGKEEFLKKIKISGNQKFVEKFYKVI